jgi:hypothetical protein
MHKPEAEGAALRQLEFVERTVNDLAESAKLYWRWWGPLGEPMVRATEEWQNTQRDYLASLRRTREKAGRDESLGGPDKQPPSIPAWPWVPPLRGLTYASWPGAGDSEGGGWDR